MFAFISSNYLAIIVLVSWLLPSYIEAVCWDTGCQLNSWAVKGCGQYNMRETGRRSCNGGVIYSCCDQQSSNVVTRQASSPPPTAAASNSCWDTGCQLSSWAIRGCEQYNMVTTKTRSCSGGTIYTCCKPLEIGDPVQVKQGESPSCGVMGTATAFISNGFRTTRGQYPWHVALYHREGGNSVGYRCGANLVSRNKVITAAHCVSSGGTKVDPDIVVLYLGKHTLNRDEEGSQIRHVRSIEIPSTFNTETYLGDVAVLTLSENVDFTRHVRPVCIYEADNGISSIVGKEGTVVGWGLNENENLADSLQMAKLPIVSTETCVNSYPDFFSKYASDGTFCAGLLNGTSPCSGDSGGGIVFNRNSIWYLRGVVSFSVDKGGFCSPAYGNFYVVFTDLSRFSNFIQTNL